MEDMGHSRYLFERDFSQHSKVAMNTDAYHDTPANQCEESAYETGYLAGRQDVHNEQQTNSSDYMSQILKALDRFKEMSEQRKKKIENQILIAIRDLAYRFAVQIEPETILTNPEFGFVKILESLHQDTNLTLLVSRQEFDFIGKLLNDSVLLPSPFIVIDDALVEGQFELRWPDGGMRFDKASLERSLDRITETFGSSPVDCPE